MSEFKRSEENPILVPNSCTDWESEAAFNGCPVRDGKKIHFLYRAVSEAHASSVGYALSKDGIHFKDRRQFIKPEYDWERFGCEDPRVTKLNGKYYIFYTALSLFPFRAEGIKVGLAITKDFKKVEKHPITPFNAKAMALFPEKINGKMAAILTVHTDSPPVKICIALFGNEECMWSREYWEEWHANLDSHMLVLERSPSDHVEVGAPPIKTKHGWLLFYSYIQNYFTPSPTFGIEAVLLDLKNPQKVIARIENPLLIPQEEYEKYGSVPNIIFPSGAFLKGDKIFLYYGATDTVCAVATGSAKELTKELLKSRITRFERFKENPILQPIREHPWESKAVFNPGVVQTVNRTHLLYRAMSDDNTSVLGHASTFDGFKISERLPEPAYVPRKDFEMKSAPGLGSGCEDPRLTKIGDTLYMCYTAYNGKDFPRVALSSIKFDDFINHKWDWTEPILISPPDIDDKDAAIFPKKFKGKYAILHRLGVSIWIDFVDDLEFKNGKWLKGKILMSPRQGHRDSKKIGIAGPPIETSAGWLLVYHGISKKSDNHYHFRAALLDLKDPTKVLARTKDTIFEPERSYEKYGITPNVVFSNGAAVIGGRLVVYYGGADTVVGVASIELSTLLKVLIAEGKLGKEKKGRKRR